MKRILLASLIALLGCAGVFAEIRFDSAFECGNGTAFSQTAPDTYSFEIEQDTNSDDRQWFEFRVEGAKRRPLAFQLLNPGGTNIPEHWETARPVFSSDGGKTWSRVEGATSLTSDTFTFQHAPATDAELIAFHHPYSHTHLLQRLDQWDNHPAAKRGTIGKSVEGRDLDLLQITNPATPLADKAGAWIIARQHAAETTGSWVADGFMDFVLSDDPRAVALRDRMVVNIVPMVNPDGVVAGNYRDNANGVNLNRSWGSATLEKDPEIVHVERAIKEWVDAGNSYVFFADLHSDSAATSHYAFHAGPDVKPAKYARPDEYHADSVKFMRFVAANTPDFNVAEGSSNDPSSAYSRQSQMQNYGALAFVFEATYTYPTFGPNKKVYITPERHRAVGTAIGIALYDYYLAGRGTESAPRLETGP